MAEEEEKGLIIDRDDWIWFVGGGLAALLALYLIKHILEPGGYHYHHHEGHHHPRPIPIAKEVEKVYKVDYEGKMY